MTVRFHSHAKERLGERGATEEEVRQTVFGGESFPAKHGRTGFRRVFPYGSDWRGRYYDMKQIEAYTVMENGDWLIITVLVKFY